MPKLNSSSLKPAWTYKTPASTPWSNNKEINKFYKSTPWRNIRLIVLKRQPLCVSCQKKGEIKTANVVDHILPIRLGGKKLELTNLQSLCVSCHNSKSSKEKKLNLNGRGG
tara:strand:+ start:594 stop:926 length:333 start_codon:yes stop_codon:yes gene_type:complete